MRFNGRRDSRLLEVLLMAAWASVGSLPALAGEIHQFNVPAEPAPEAIRDFASQAKVEILVAGDSVRNKHLHAVAGKLSTAEGLKELLADSGLTAQYVAGRSIALVSPHSQPIEVNGVQTGKEGKRSSSGAFRGAQTNGGQNTGTAALTGADQAGGGSQLDEIIVTAQKRSERLIDVPSSIIAVTSVTLQQQHLVGLEDYVANVPGLTFSSDSSGYQQLVIRGLNTGSAGNPTVATYIDNAPVGWSTSSANGELMTESLDPNDLQQIEVLRGPQGTLYGADNLGGLVKYDLIQPDTHRINGRVWVDGVDDTVGGNGYAARGLVNAPLISGKLAVLVSGFTRDDPGYIRNAALNLTHLNDTHAHGGRVALLWNATDDISVRLAALNNDLSVGGASQEDVDPVTLDPVYGDLQQRRAAGTGVVSSRFWLYTGNIDWDLGWGKLTSTTSYETLSQINSQDFTNYFQPAFAPLFGPNLGYAIHDDDRQSKAAEEVRLGFRTGPQLDWRLGAFYTHEKANVFEFTDAFNPVTAVPVPLAMVIEHAVSTTTYSEYALFGEGTYHLTRRFDLAAGVRYAHNDLTVGQNYLGLIIGAPVVQSVESSGDATTFQFSPRLKLGRGTMVYGRIASGYRPGGANYPTSPPTPGTYSSDRDTNYEVGIKTSLPEERLSLDLALFYMNWKSIQLPLITPLGLNYIGNASAASTRGIESTINYMPVVGLDISGSLSYTAAHLDQPIPSGAVGRPGDPLPYSPLWKGTLYVDYTFRPLGEWMPFVGATYLFMGAVDGNFARNVATPRISLPAYQTIDARLGIRNDRWTLQLLGKNLANRHSITDEMMLSPNPQAPVGADIVPPRTLMLSVIARF